jgi:hypothetical protein
MTEYEVPSCNQFFYELVMKSLPILFLLALITSSCFTTKNLTKHEAITHDFLASLKPGKKYVFELKIGTRQYVRIKQVTDEIISGQIYEKNNDGKKVWSDYSETFENMEKNVSKISVIKLNPYLTTASITVVTVVTTFMLVIYFGWK